MALMNGLFRMKNDRNKWSEQSETNDMNKWSVQNKTNDKNKWSAQNKANDTNKWSAQNKREKVLTSLVRDCFVVLKILKKY